MYLKKPFETPPVGERAGRYAGLLGSGHVRRPRSPTADGYICISPITNNAPKARSFAIYFFDAVAARELKTTRVFSRCAGALHPCKKDILSGGRVGAIEHQDPPPKWVETFSDRKDCCRLIGSIQHAKGVLEGPRTWMETVGFFESRRHSTGRHDHAKWRLAQKPTGFLFVRHAHANGFRRRKLGPAIG